MFFSWRAVGAYLLFLCVCSAAFASQNNLFSPTTGTVSGLNLTQNFNNAIDSLNTMNSGGSAPTNQLSGSPSAGNQWLNTSGAQAAEEIYDGTNWLIRAWLDNSNHVYVPVMGGGAANNVASASTTDPCSTNPAYINVTGTTTITSFGSNCALGQWKRIKFTGILTLTYNASSMILPNNASNITTAAGDTADAVYLGSGNWIVTHYQRASGAALSSQGLSVGAGGLANSALSDMGQPVNIGLTTSVGSNALTVNITDSTGATPSSSSPVLIPFRSATLATGTPTFDSLQGALGITVAAGNTMGCSNNVACRLWIYIVDNAGTPVVGLMNCSNATNTFQCNDDLLYATASGTSGGNSAGTLYGSTGSLSGKAVRIVGYLEATETTAGTWATAPSKLQLFGPGVHKPGEVIQTIFLNSPSGGTTSSTVFGVAWTQSITPSSAVNLVLFTGTGSGQTSSGVSNSNMVWQPFRASTALGNPMTAGQSGAGTASVENTFSFSVLDQPNTTSSTAYNIEVKASGSSGTVTYSNSTIILQEIMGALDEPANDNGLARMVG